MLGKRIRGRPRMRTIKDLIDGTYKGMKDLREGRNRDCGCRRPASGQTTNDDDDVIMSKSTTQVKFINPVLLLKVNYNSDL